MRLELERRIDVPCAAVSWTPDGRTFVAESGWQRQPVTLRLHDTDGRLLSTIVGASPRFSPDGERLATRARKGPVEVRARRQGAPVVHTLRGPLAGAPVAFDPHAAAILYTQCSSRSDPDHLIIARWDVVAGKGRTVLRRRCLFPGHTHAPAAFCRSGGVGSALSPEGGVLAAWHVGWDQRTPTAQAWFDLSSGELLEVFERPDAWEVLGWTPDGKALGVATPRGVLLFRPGDRPDQPSSALPSAGRARAWAWLPDGERVVLAVPAGSRTRVTLVDARRARALGEAVLPASTGVALGAGGLLAAAHDRWCGLYSLRA